MNNSIIIDMDTLNRDGRNRQSQEGLVIITYILVYIMVCFILSLIIFIPNCDDKSNYKVACSFKTVAIAILCISTVSFTIYLFSKYCLNDHHYTIYSSLGDYGERDGERNETDLIINGMDISDDIDENIISDLV